MTDRSTAPDLDPLDRIDRSIEIAAGADVVWGLVSDPLVDQRGHVAPEPDVVVREGDRGGPSRTGCSGCGRRECAGPVRRYLVSSASRWLDPGPSRRVRSDAGSLDDRAARRGSDPGRERVLHARQAAEEWLRHRESNVDGWATELDAARRFTEGERA